MLLRSSSTPILGSLLSSSCSPHFSDSPNHHHHHHESTTILHTNFSPGSDHSDHTLGFRRIRSDGNLHAILSDSSHEHRQHHAVPSKPPPSPLSSSRRSNPARETIPCFSVKSPKELSPEEARELDDRNNHRTHRTFTTGEAIAEECIQDQNTGSSMHNSDGIEQGNGSLESPLFIARGLGIDRIGSGLLTAGNDSSCNGSGGGGYGGNRAVLTANGGDQYDMDMYYKKMVQENPSNALLLSNYAEFLYQSKGDHKRAEEYYSRAILANPGDGEILSKYAKIVWELHKDKERASSYFEQAVQTAPGDSHVLAAYAGFLWETEDDEGTKDGQLMDFLAEGPVHAGPFASATA